MSRKLLTDDNLHLQLFEDGVSINKSLLKWRNAEKNEEKTQSPHMNEDVATYIVNSNNVFSSIGTPNSVETSSSDVDSNIDAGTRWLPLYQTPEGLSFDEIASAGIKDLTKLIVEKKVKYVMAGYGSFGSTRNDGVEYSINTYPYDYSGVKAKDHQQERKESKIKNLFSKIFKKNKKEDEKYEFDAIKFFSLVKATSKESAFTYRDRVSNYLRALHNAVDIGQTALQEELLKGLITNKYESALFAEGYYYVIDEDTIVDFIKKCEKGLSLDYIKNFSRPIPQEVVNKISKLNELEIFDNYVVLHYDPAKTAYKETEYERAKRKDPIIFGLIAGSKKLYYVTDWIDEYCDLTLEKFVDTLGIKKENLYIDGVKEDKTSDTKEKKVKKRKYYKKNKKN